MKYQTLTSSLVLTFLLAGATAQAMDADEADNKGGLPAVIQPLGDATELDGANTATPNAVPSPITEADWFTYSQINPDNFKLLTQVVSAGTDEDKEAALAALKKDIEAQKYAKNTQEAIEQETVLMRLYGWLTAPFQQVPLPPQQDVLSTEIALETFSGKNALQNMAVNLQPEGKETETVEEAAPSYFSKFNPFNWWGGSAPAVDPRDNAVAEFFPLSPVAASPEEPEKNSEIK